MRKRNAWRRRSSRGWSPAVCAICLAFATGLTATVGLASDENAEPIDSESTANDARRILVFASGGPLVVDVAVLIGGEPLTAARGRLLERLLTSMRGEEGGRPRWYAALDDPQLRMLNADFGAGMTRVRKSEIERQYDANRDGYVDRLELTRYLEDLPNSGSEFRMEGSNANRDRNRFGSRLAALFDADGDGRLALAEAADGAEGLKRYDVDDDDLLYAAEIDPEQSMTSGMSRFSPSVPGPPAAMVLDGATNWASVYRTLDELYQTEGRLGLSSFRLVSRLADRIDSNDDGVIDRDEVLDLATTPPHLVVTVRFGSESDEEGESDEVDEVSLLSVRIADPQLRCADRRTLRQADRAVMEWLTDKVSIRVRDAANDGTNLAAVEQQFSMLDGDSNGYLDEEEMSVGGPAAAALYAAADEDENGELYLEEIRAFYRERVTPQQSRVSVSVGHDPDATFSVLDTSGDARLSLRELRMAAERLARLDANQDEVVAGYELPDALSIEIVRGGGEMVMPVGMSMVATRPTGEGPAWFDRMDLNRDGDVSRREFPGRGEQFDAVDSDGDGFIDRHEARSAAPDEETDDE